jgi:hypothetical protein
LIWMPVYDLWRFTLRGGGIQGDLVAPICIVDRLLPRGALVCVVRSPVARPVLLRTVEPAAAFFAKEHR